MAHVHAHHALRRPELPELPELPADRRGLPERIRAHALICFLSLVLYRVMRMRLRANGSTHSPKTTLELLRRLPKHRVQLSGQRLTGIDMVSSLQLELFAALGIQKPA